MDMFMEEGRSAYVDESWKELPPGEETLQKQARELFRRLGVEPHEVLAANLIPMRSPSWDTLENQRRALAFGIRLWSDILAEHTPPLVIANGVNRPFRQLCGILGADGDVEEVPVHWRNYTGRRVSFPGGHLIGLPHLSRFTIMTRRESRSAIDQLLGLDPS